MGKQNLGSQSEVQRDESKVDKWIGLTDNVKQNLLDLKDEIKKNKEGSKTLLKLSEEDFDKKFEKEFALFNTNLDKIAEQDFDVFAQKHRSELQKIIYDDNDTTRKQKLDALSLEFQKDLFSKTDEYFDDIQALATTPFTIEINDLYDQVNISSLKSNITGEGGPDHPFNALPGEGTEIKENEPYSMTDDYVDEYHNFTVEGSGNIGVTDQYEIINPFKNTKTVKYLEKLFDDEEMKEVRKGTLRINLSKEDGLARIITDIRNDITDHAKEYLAYDQSGERNDDNNFICDKLGIKLTFYKENEIDQTDSDKYFYLSSIDRYIEIDFPEEGDLRKNLNDQIKTGLITYHRKGGLDNEIRKISKILKRVKWKDLDNFASLDETDIRDRYNAQEITGQNKEKKEKGKKQKSLINENNVFTFLCDISGEGQLSAEYKKKNNKAQKYQGDVGPLFGQQIMRTIEQSIKLKNAELGEPAGEQLVISNIIKNMDIRDQTLLTKPEKDFIDGMMNDPENCTRKNLAILINGYEASWLDEEDLTDTQKQEKKDNPLLFSVLKKNNITTFEGMPEFKIFFLDAIKNINGGTQETTPDLSNTLMGTDAKEIADIDTTQEKIKSNIDAWLTKIKGLNNKDQEKLRALIAEKGVVHVRETLFTNIMRALDNLTITTKDGNFPTKFPMAGVSKSREIRSTKKEILEQIERDLSGNQEEGTKREGQPRTLVGGGIHYSETQGRKISLNIGQTGVSESYRTKRSRGAETGLTFGLGKVDISIGIHAEIAEQYNYKKVVNASLDKVKTAKYVGVEGGALASISLKDRGIDAELYEGLNRSQDPVAGINQIDKQYEDVSALIFSLEDTSYTNEKNTSYILKDKKTFSDYFKNRIASYKSDPEFGGFVTNNVEHLEKDLDFIAEYMSVNGFFLSENDLLKDKTPEQRKIAINALLNIMQSGNRASRRNDLIAALPDKVSLTKLSFGATTKAFTLKTGRPIKNKTNEKAPTANAATGQGLNEGDLGAGAGQEQAELGQSRFGIFGVYVGLRLSTWRNMYVPNTQQYLYTQYEMGQGLHNEYLESPYSDLDTYAKYLAALYNDSRLSFNKDTQSNKLIVTFEDSKHPDLTLARFLNLHATKEAEKNFSLQDNTLIIGNVGDIGAYTVTEARGIRRILCLGTKKLDDAHRVTKDNTPSSIEEVKDEVTGYKAWKQDKLTTDIVNTMKGTGTNVDAVKTDVSKFLVDGKVKVPATLTGKVTLDPQDLETKDLTVGTLIITKNTDGTYRISLVDYPTDTFTLKYIDKTEYQTALEEAQNNVNNRESISVFNGTKDTFFEFESASELYKVQSLLNTLEGDIKDIEKDASKKNKTEYLQYLSAASNVLGNTGEIDDTEITNALGYLKTLLSGSKVTNIENLITYMGSNDRYTKTYIVDRCKQIFAKDEAYSGKSLAAILSSHTVSAWETVTGPSNNRIPDVLLKELRTQRSKWAKSTDTYNDSPDPIPNLMGYTAFYRYETGEHYKNVKFSMTSLGNTTSQVEPYIIKNTQEAEQWFMDNFKKNEKEVEYFAKTLEKKITAKGKSATIFVKDKYSQTLMNIENIMKGKPLDSGEKISIKRDMVFYLLGDCCNESIGMNIVNISIESLKDNVVDNLKGNYQATGTPDVIYKKGMNIAYKSHSIASTGIAKEEKVSLRHHVSTYKEPAPEANVTTGGSGGGSSGGNTNGGNLGAGGGGNE